MATFGVTDPYESLRNDPNKPGQQQQNAQSGANGSLQNAAVQSTGKSSGSSNPFEAMLNHATAFNQARQSQFASQTPAGQMAAQYGTPQPMGGGSGASPQQPAFGPGAVPPSWNLPDSFTPRPGTPGPVDENGNSSMPQSGIGVAPGTQMYSQMQSVDPGTEVGAGGTTSANLPQWDPNRYNDPSNKSGGGAGFAPATTEWTQGGDPLNPVDGGGDSGGGAATQPPPSTNPWSPGTGGQAPFPTQPEKPANTEDPEVAAKWYQSQGIPEITAQDVIDFRNWSMAQQAGGFAGADMSIATWYDQFRRNKPGNTEDPNVAANWYRTYTGFGEVTGDDVTNFRNWASGTGNQNVRFEDWYSKMGKPLLTKPWDGGGGGGQEPYDESRYYDPSLKTGGGAKEQPLAPTTPAPTTPTAPVDPSNPTLPENAAPGKPIDDPLTLKPGDPGYTDPNTPFAGGEKLGDVDVLAELRKMLDPQFNLESDRLNRVMRGQAALDGSIDSGGFGESLGSSQAQLAANQGSRLTDYSMKARESQLDRKQQFAIAKMQDDLARYGIKTQGELEKYLAANENELKKYGIDKNDLLERYKSEMGLKGAQIQADAAIQAGQLHAAAAAAAGAAASAAAARDAEIRLQLGLAGLDVGREDNILRAALGNRNADIDILRIIAGMSPDQMISAFPFFPGGYTGKP